MDNDNEIWKDAVGYEGRFQVSSHGRARSVPKGKVKTSRVFNLGFLGVYLGVKNTFNGGVVNVYVHRMVAQAFVPNPYNKPHVNHINGNKLDNRACNLEWCTKSENAIHAYKHGLTRRLHGERCGMSKLKDADVRDIRARRISGESCKSIQSSYKHISVKTIYGIIARERWKHI